MDGFLDSSSDSSIFPKSFDVFFLCDLAEQLNWGNVAECPQAVAAEMCVLFLSENSMFFIVLPLRICFFLSWINGSINFFSLSLFLFLIL